jgi:predicted nucleotide-binding protein
VAKIFISYNQRDIEITKEIVEKLKSRGHTVLWDNDLLRVGLNWRDVLAQAMRECSVVVSILTEHSISSSYTMSELGAARILGKIIVPLIFGGMPYPNIVQDLHAVRVFDSNLDEVIERIHTDISHFATENKKVFIVHGQNEAKKLEIKDFLAKLALDPIILHQQNDLGKTIIEKFEHYASQCAFAVVLLTPDDQTIPKDSSIEGAWRARQNVIMELGWFMAKLGRERVLLLHQGQIEIPTDILGIIYAHFNSSVTEAGETIRERLKNVGLLS